MNKEAQDILNNEFKSAIAKLERHADTSNKEVGVIQGDIKVIKSDITWFKDKISSFEKRFDSFNNKAWGIIAAVITMVIVEIIKAFIK